MYLTETMWKSGATLPDAPQMHIPMALPPMILPETSPSPLGRIGYTVVSPSSGFQRTQSVQKNGMLINGVSPLWSDQGVASDHKITSSASSLGLKNTESVAVGDGPAGGHLDISCEMKTNHCLPGAVVELIVSMQNKSPYDVVRVFIEVVKRNETSNIVARGETVSLQRDTVVNSYRYDHVQDFVGTTALVNVKLPPYIEPLAEYFIQARVELNVDITPFCRVPLSFSANVQA
jgi:hypothetical protein